MSFITGNRKEIIEEYTKIKKVKGKYVIPIGKQELYIKSVEFKLSKAGNEMIVIAIGKKPEDVGENRISFNSITQYYTQYRIKELLTFVKTTFNLDMVYKSMEEIESIIAPIKGLKFNAIIMHQKRLVLKDGLPAERKYLKNMNQWGLPIISYEPRIWKVNSELKPEEHRLLVQDFNQEEKEIFNLTLLNRQNILYGTIDD